MTVDYRSGDLVAPLSEDEATRLRIKENAIERGADEVARALAVIRDERLYRAEYSTFEAYCRERWGMTYRRANQQIAAAEVNEIVGTIGSQLTERAARELADLRDDPETLRETYQQAHEATGGNVTAKAIREVRNPDAEVIEDDQPRALGDDETVDLETGEIVPVRHLSPVPDPSPAPTPPLKPVVSEDEWTQQDRAEELASDLAAHLSLLFALTVPERRAEYIANWHLGVDHRPVLGQKYVKPSVMREIADALHTFASEWENANV